MTGDETLVPGAASGGTDGALEREGTVVGPYRLLRQLGEGGFGSVWLAERRQPFVQQVALKIVKAGMDSRAVVARFDQERQVLAVMSHPHVAKVIDGGLTPQGRPYFAMEYVRGVPINDYADRARMSVPDRLRLFLQVCDAVQHAHTKGIIHRDLKPSNILVSTDDADRAVAKVIDFGIAKAITGRMTEQTVFTESGQMIGTPEYMSPEQAEPGETDIDTRTDVYSLGVVLYELLAGQLPFEPSELRSRAYREIQRIIREDDPPTPSSRLSTLVTREGARATQIAAVRRLDAAALARTLRTELEWIPLKAMRKDRRERYESPAGLARDVENYLSGRPLLAAPESTSYRVRKYVRRNRGLVAGSSAVLAAILAGLAVATWQWREAEGARTEAVTARDAADRARSEAESQRDAAESARKEAESQQQAAVAARDRAENLAAVMASGRALDAARAADPDAVDREAAVLRDLGRGDGFPARLAGAIADQSDGKAIALEHAGMPGGGETGLPEAVVQRMLDRVMGGAMKGASAIALSPDGRTVASVGMDRAVVLRDLATGRTVGDPLSGHDELVFALAFSGDGKRLASGDADGSIRIWSVPDGARIAGPIRAHGGASVREMAFAPAGTLLASAGDDGTVQVWDAATGNLRGTLDSQRPLRTTAIAFAPDGGSIACAVVAGGSGEASMASAIRRWDASSLTRIGAPIEPIDGVIESIALSPDGSAIASAGPGDSIRRWRVATGEPIGAPLRGHAGSALDVAFSPDGKILASGGADRTIRLWDSDTGRQVGEPLLGQRSAVSLVRFAPEGKAVLGASLNQEAYTAQGSRLDTRVRRWDVSAPVRTAQLWGHSDVVSAVAVSRDGATIASGSGDGTIRLWDAQTAQPLGIPLRGHRGTVNCVAFSPDGKLLASCAVDGAVRLWDAATGLPVGEPMRPDRGSATCVAFSPDGKLLATATGARDMESGFMSGGIDSALGTTGDEDLMASSVIRTWDAGTRALVGEPIRGEWTTVSGLAFSPDSRMLAAVAGGPAVHLWEIATRKPSGIKPRRESAGMNAVAFSPDGRLIATADDDKLITLWDTSTGEQSGKPLSGHDGEVLGIAFSHDGRTIASASTDTTVRLWDVPSRSEVGKPLLGHSRRASGVAFDARGEVLVSGGWDSTVRIWRATPIRERIGAIRAIAEAAAQVVKTIAEEFDAVPGEPGPMRGFLEQLIADPRFEGERRRPALIALGELEVRRWYRQMQVARRMQAIGEAYRAKDWARVLDLLHSMQEPDLPPIPARFWNELAWLGLTELPAESPSRRLEQLLRYAERAVELTERKDGANLDTLARAHWERGDKPTAVAVQREAIEATRAAGGDTSELEQALARYEAGEPPRQAAK